MRLRTGASAVLLTALVSRDTGDADLHGDLHSTSCLFACPCFRRSIDPALRPHVTQPDPLRARARHRPGVAGTRGRSTVMSLLLDSTAATLLEWLPCDPLARAPAAPCHVTPSAPASGVVHGGVRPRGEAF